MERSPSGLLRNRISGLPGFDFWLDVRRQKCSRKCFTFKFREEKRSMPWEPFRESEVYTSGAVINISNEVTSPTVAICQRNNALLRWTGAHAYLVQLGTWPVNEWRAWNGKASLPGRTSELRRAPDWTALGAMRCEVLRTSEQGKGRKKCTVRKVLWGESPALHHITVHAPLQQLQLRHSPKGNTSVSLPGALLAGMIWGQFAT